MAATIVLTSVKHLKQEERAFGAFLRDCSLWHARRCNEQRLLRAQNAQERADQTRYDSEEACHESAVDIEAEHAARVREVVEAFR